LFWISVVYFVGLATIRMAGRLWLKRALSIAPECVPDFEESGECLTWHMHWTLSFDGVNSRSFAVEKASPSILLIVIYFALVRC
jgi:hypothetical protein